MRRPLPRFANSSLLAGTAALLIAASPFAVQARVAPTGSLPASVDVRLLSQGAAPRAIQPAQIKAIRALRAKIGGVALDIRYSTLTATPRSLFVPGGYLSAPSVQDPEAIARRFLHDNRGLYRFSDEDLANLRLRTRSVAADTGTTILVFEQQLAGLPVYHGDVLVNVARSGAVLGVGNEVYPQLTLTNRRSISAAQAVSAAAAGVGVSGYSPSSIGARPVLTTYGELAPEYVEAPSFAGDGHFSDEINVVPVIFPMGDTARHAWKLNFTDKAHYSILWQTVVDAETGAVLSRRSLTAFQQGGGVGKGRRSTFRPDMQDFVEAKNAAMTASGKVFDDQPTVLSGVAGFGRSVRSGTAPNYTYTQPLYGAANLASGADGYGFRYVLLAGRNKNGLPFGDNNTPAKAETFTQAALSDKLGQVLRGFPDATNPSAASPFGWFYLPTGPGGAEIAAATADHGTTRAFGYAMTPEAKIRNKVFGNNAPGADGDQPYSATLTTLPGPVTLADGRVLGSVWQSNYTEGNNSLVADDRFDDDSTTMGVRGYSATRQFTTAQFDFVGGYEYGPDATKPRTGAVSYPPGADTDVPSSDLSLFNITNLVHDYLYGIGFTETMWNFQQDNFGRGGAGGDALRADTMDGSGLDNANMGTPAEGSFPRMQMFLNTDASGSERRSDSSYEWDTVAHEFYHGVSNRSAAKGSDGCLGTTFLVGESGGMGEGWGDFFADSVSEADNVFDYTSGLLDSGLRAMPSTNYRWSYASVDGRFRRRDSATNPAANTGDGNIGTPFEVHQVGEIFTPILWDMRELLIVKQPSGTFYDGSRRLGNGTKYYIGDRALQSLDTAHPIDYRVGFGTTTNGTAAATLGVTLTLDDKHAIRSGLIADEIARRGDRKGPLATAVSTGGRLADALVLRALQLGECNPTFVSHRDSILQADLEMNGGENRAVIWRAWASHGVGASAVSSGAPGDGVSQGAPVIVEGFDVPAGVTQCETSGPLTSPEVTVVNTVDNTATLTITPATGTAATSKLLIARASSAIGPYAPIATIAAPTTGNVTYADKDGGSGLLLGRTYYYRVRESRDAENNCVSQSKDADIRSVTIGKGAPITANPVFAGVGNVDDPRQCETLNGSWSAASSSIPTAKLVYDVFRVPSVAASNGTIEPTFTPATANKVQSGLTGTSFIDRGLTRNQPYYYIVRARDADSGRIDTANTGNLIVKYNAPSSPARGTSPFAKETYEAAPATGRFLPALVDSATPNQALPVWQRVSNVDFGGGLKSGAMYAPDFDPGSDGAQSDFSTVIGPLTITADSLLEFDSKINAEAGFDGGVVELSFTPQFNATPFPDNRTTFDLGDYMTQGGYNSKLDASLAAGTPPASPLQGRRAFTGARGLTHTAATLQAFATGGAHAAPNSQVYIRFRMTSDSGSTAGAGAGWFVDNLSVTNLAACPANLPPVGVLSATPKSGAAPLLVRFSGAKSSDPNGSDSIVSYTFDFGDGSPAVTQSGAETSHSYPAGNYTATLTVKDDQGAASAIAASAQQVIQVTTAGGANTAPTARLVADKTMGNAPLTVQFDAATSSDADAGDAIASYSFDLDGDGTYEIVDSTSSQQSKVYSVAKVYSAKVKVKDKAGAESTPATLTITVNSDAAMENNRAPMAILAVTNGTGPAPLGVHFDGSSSVDPDSGDYIADFRFDFGDGSKVQSGSNKLAYHSYTVPGEYAASLVVTDSHGAASAAKTFIVKAVASGAAPVPNGPSPSVDTRQGGGAFDPRLLAGLVLLLLARRRRRCV